MAEPGTPLKAVAQALDAIGLAPNGDEQLAEDFLNALRELGFTVAPDPASDPDKRGGKP
jgi:hypothetical protein